MNNPSSIEISIEGLSDIVNSKTANPVAELYIIQELVEKIKEGTPVFVRFSGDIRHELMLNDDGDLVIRINQP